MILHLRRMFNVCTWRKFHDYAFLSVLVKILGMGRTKLPKGAPHLSLGGQIVIFCWIETIIDFDRHGTVL